MLANDSYTFEIQGRLFCNYYIQSGPSFKQGSHPSRFTVGQKAAHVKDVLNNLATTLLMYGAAVLMTLGGMVFTPVALDISMVHRGLKTLFHSWHKR